MSVDSSVVQVQTVWHTPPSGFIKVTVDAALLNHGCAVGMGMVARGNVNEEVSWKSEVLYQPFSPEVAEAVALQTAVQWALEKEWSTLLSRLIPQPW